MNGILSKSSDSKLHGLISPKNPEAVETAGSLAMNVFHSLFENNSYDEFSTNNPFAVDYSLYADCGESVAYDGFLSDFSNAVSVINSDGGSFGGDCGFSSSSSSCGFTSFC